MSGNMVRCALLIACQTSTATIALAQERSFDFTIPAGSLDDALKRYARTTGRQVLYRSITVEGRRSAGVSGRADAEQALDRLLAGSGLVARRPSPGVIIIEAQPTTPAVSTSASDMPSDVIVTGTNIRDAASTTAVRTISRRELQASGRATVADVIAALPGNFGGTGNPVAALTGADSSSGNNTLSSAADLRGLGSDATLTLFDGRRIAGSGGRGDITDLSALPSLAVDRVEILSDGASAIYGSDAVGGVINLILRHRMKGVEMRLRGGTTTDGGVRNAIASIATGRDWKTGGLFVTYEFEHRDALAGAKRAFTATGDLRAFGGTDRRTFYSSPGTILSFDPVSGGFTPAFRIPMLPDGATPTLSDLTPGGNLYNPIAGFDLSPHIDRHAFYGHAEQRVNDALDVFADVRFARRDFGYHSPASITPFLVTAANPYFLPVDGQSATLIGYSFSPELGAGRTRGQVTSFGATAGANWAVGAWAMSGYGSFARERSRDRSDRFVNASALDEALGTSPDDPETRFSTATDGFFNPYGSGTSNSRTILDFIGSGFVALQRRSRLIDATLKADGPITELPGGTMRAAVGTAFRDEGFVSDGSTFYSGAAPSEIGTLRGKRQVVSVFAEVNIPLVGASNRVAGVQALTVSGAVRHERYSDFGSTTNPKIGLAWSPAIGVTLRGSWGTSFRAPALVEVNDRRTISPTQLPDGLGGYIPAIFVGGGNRGLGPERATTLSGGMTLEPAPAPGLRFSYNLFSTRFRNRIAQPALQDILRVLTDPALASFVERIDPAGDATALTRVETLLADPNAASAGGLPATSFQAIVDGRWVNTGRLSVAGMDADITWSRPIGSNTLDAGLSATWLFRYDVQATPQATVVERLDTLGNPAAIRVRAHGGVTGGRMTAMIFGNWVNGYRDDLSVPYRSIDSFFTADLTLGATLSRGVLAGTRITLAIDNLFDAAPPFVDRATGIGFDAANANPFGRSIALEVRRTF